MNSEWQEIRSWSTLMHAGLCGAEVGMTLTPQSKVRYDCISPRLTPKVRYLTLGTRGTPYYLLYQ